jgi:hypothetical protein
MRLIALGGAMALAFAGCGGSEQQAGAGLAGLQASQPSVALHTYHVARSGVSVDLHVRANTVLPNSSIRFQRSEKRARTTEQACLSIPPIEIFNPRFVPITIGIPSFTVHLPCANTGMLFGATWTQIKPLPSVIAPLKIGDATAIRRAITFAPGVQSVTLAPRTRYELIILPEQSTSDVAFPVVPSATTNLTANATDVTSGTTFNGLTFSYPNASGASSYSAACFPAFVNGQLASFLQNVALVGTPSFYCDLTTPFNAPVTFGQTVKFNVLSPPADRALFEPDGVPQGFACSAPSNNSSSCNVPQFSIPTTYQNFIVGNVQDLRSCVPVTSGVDCNGFGTDRQGGARTNVPCCREFQLLVADDPTYKPPASSLQPWDGLFRMTYTPGVCVASTGPDNDHDGPPGYSDSAQKGIGPAAEFDVALLASGTCTITVTEDSKYIIDDSNPSAPTPRSATITLTVGQVPATLPGK